MADSPSNAARPAAVAEALRDTREALAELLKDAHEVFCTSSQRTPQVVRDAIEYMSSSMEVFLNKRIDALAALAQPSVEAPAAVEVSRLAAEAEQLRAAWNIAENELAAIKAEVLGVVAAAIRWRYPAGDSDSACVALIQAVDALRQSGSMLVETTYGHELVKLGLIAAEGN